MLSAVKLTERKGPTLVFGPNPDGREQRARAQAECVACPHVPRAQPRITRTGTAA